MFESFPENGPLGVRVIVQVEPFPPLTSVELNPCF
jgi:outer membrane protein insertion porin family